MINPDNFCIGPWAEVRINPNGSMNFCHAADQLLIPPPDNIAEITVDQYFAGSQSVLKARGDLEQGRSIDRCHRCYKDEQAGLVSFRQRRNLQAAIFPGQDFVPSVAEAWPRIHSWHKPRFYHISLSNLCNMACMMCDPQYSSLLTSTQRGAGVLRDNVPILRDWTQDENIWDQFVQHLLRNQEIVCLHFMGGEPMYHKKFWQLLDTLIDHDHCDFALTFVTNGSIYDPKIISRLERFRSVDVEISVESLDSSNDYIRYPSKYLDIQQNIIQYLDHRSASFNVVLRSTPQLLSAVGYHHLLEFAQTHRVMIDSNVLHKPSFMALNALPEQAKQSVIARLLRFVNHQGVTADDINLRDITDFDRSLSLHAQAVIAQINLPCNDLEQRWQMLVDYCRKMDRVRHLDVTEMIPDLAQFFLDRGYRD